jgi:hypothetical protein
LKRRKQFRGNVDAVEDDGWGALPVEHLQAVLIRGGNLCAATNRRAHRYLIGHVENGIHAPCSEAPHANERRVAAHSVRLDIQRRMVSVGIGQRGLGMRGALMCAAYSSSCWIATSSSVGSRNKKATVRWLSHVNGARSILERNPVTGGAGISVRLDDFTPVAPAAASMRPTIVPLRQANRLRRRPL